RGCRAARRICIITIMRTIITAITTITVTTMTTTITTTTSRRALIAGALATAIATRVSAQGSSAEIALYAGADRTQRLIDGAKKEGVVTLYASAPNDDLTALAT